MLKILKKLAFHFLVYSFGLLAINGLSALSQKRAPKSTPESLLSFELKRVENTAKSGTHGTAKRLQGSHRIGFRFRFICEVEF